MKRPRFEILMCALGLLMLATFLASCESRDKYVGIYEAEAKGTARQESVVLELKANGDGLWKVTSPGKKDSLLPEKGIGASPEKKGSVEVPFTWYIKHGHLRINTQEGGVIVGKLHHTGVISITLPGSKTLTFTRQ
jgi:hypothetical protein